MSRRMASKCLAATLAAFTISLSPVAHATPSADHSESQSSRTQYSHDGKSRIEYRSAKDREAFEKFGRYIKVSTDGTLSEEIPASQRKNDRDAAKRIDEFVEIANQKHSGGKSSPITFYGNETKIDHWGPIQKVYLSHDVVNKATKLAGLADGASAIAGMLVAEGLTGLPGWIVAGLTALIAAGNVCDWNDQGIIIWQVPGVPVPECTPQK